VWRADYKTLTAPIIGIKDKVIRQDVISRLRDVFTVRDSDRCCHRASEGSSHQQQRCKNNEYAKLLSLLQVADGTVGN